MATFENEKEYYQNQFKNNKTNIKFYHKIIQNRVYFKQKKK